MRTVEQTADELVEKFIHAQDNTKFETSDENYRKCQSLNEELGSEVDVYWQRLAIQCAIIAVDEIIESNPTEINEKHYIKPYTSDYMESSIPFWQQIKHELEKRLK